jgi:hypothetical protein
MTSSIITVMKGGGATGVPSLGGESFGTQGQETKGFSQ